MVIAIGSTSNYFGKQDIEDLALGMKPLYEAIGLRNFGLQGLEHALLLSGKQEKNELLNFVIAGGGPTGVELAGLWQNSGKPFSQKITRIIIRLNDDPFNRKPSGVIVQYE